jgi:DNA-directed RNA polymerase subunit RPC12/RpoP
MGGKIINVLLVALLVGLMSCASFQEEDKEPLVVFGDGFFSQERNDAWIWRWMGDRLPKGEGPLPLEGVVNLRNTKKEMFLKIVCDVPVYAMREAPTMKIIFNGEILEQFVQAKRDLEKNYKVPASKQSKGEYSELRITTSNFFIPSEFEKKSTDVRRMGLRLFQLTWSENEGDAEAVVLPKPAGPAPQGPAADPQKTRPKGWLVVTLLGAGMTITLVLALAAWFFVRQRRAAKTPARANVVDEEVVAEEVPAFISFACSVCGKSLKAKVEMTGKKVKCSQCGKAVLVPRPDSDQSSGTA